MNDSYVPYFFDEQTYLRLNPDVARAVAMGAFPSGAEHWRKHGRHERRAFLEWPPVTADEFDECHYLLLHPDVEAAVRGGAYSSGYEHWVNDGYKEEREFRARGVTWRRQSPAGSVANHDNFDERSYLSANPDVSAAVTAGVFESGYDHWLRKGRSEGRRDAGLLSSLCKPLAAEVLADHPHGINCYGFHSESTGLGTASRGYLSALRHAGLRVNPISVTPWHEQSGTPRPHGRASTLYGVNVIHQNADMMPLFVPTYGADTLRTRYNIGMWVWELHAGYAQWHQSARMLHEIWAPSTFVVSSLTTISPVPVIRIPYAVEDMPIDENLTRSHFDIPLGSFVFLYVFDLASNVDRKNPFALIRAFHDAFAGRKDVVLILKYSNAAFEPRSAAMLEQMAASLPNVRTIPELIPIEELGALMRAADCFVSPHRSEGFGLNIAQAMSLGKPVIATGYSGNMDFTDDANSFVIDYKLIPIPKTTGPYLQNFAWAEPSGEHLAKLLRDVEENRDHARARGELARKTIERGFSVPAVADAICQRFGEAGLGALLD